MLFNITEKTRGFRTESLFCNSTKRLVFNLTKIPFLKRLIGISRLIVEVLDDQNLFTESTLANWFPSCVQFCSGGHFSERAEAARKCGKMNHLKARSNDPIWRTRFFYSENRMVWIRSKIPSDTRIRNFDKTDRNRTCSIFIRHSSWKMKGADKFCVISLGSYSLEIEDCRCLSK